MYSIEDVFNIPKLLKISKESLGSMTDLNKVNLEITLNYPENAAYKRMKDDDKKVMYERLWQYVLINQKLIDYVVENKTNFEYGKQAGKMHMHILLKLHFNGCFCPEGLVKQIAKCWLSQLPKRYYLYDESKYWIKYFRYRCASICCQIQFVNDFERTKYWEDYIKKDNLSL